MFNLSLKKIFPFVFIYSFILFSHNCLAFNEEIISAKGIILEVETITKSAEEADLRMNDSILSDYYEEQKLKVKILSNRDKGKIVNIINDLNQNPFDIKIKKGDKVFLYGNSINGEMKYYVRDFWHLDSLIFWITLFFILVILLGKSQGLKSLLTLVISLFIIFAIYIPLILKGVNPIQVAILISLAVSCLTLPIIHGFSLKAAISIIGTVGGIFVASFFSFLVSYFSHLNGLGTEDMRLFAASNSDLNFRGILFSGIIIGALGAIMDVAVSISSGLQEIKQHKPTICFKELVISGMNIGKDIMGSMLNTLIFAYIGTSIAVVLIISQNKTGIMEFLNYDFVAEEIIRSIVGSIGLLAAIPITAITAGLMHKLITKK
ncbi:YibE/F family protein [Candidatus Gracilibacteria bacterium]|nr:YibE/F family protein [Candidatus Gracilibacteria bacterium]